MSTLVAQTISNGSISTSTANVINGAKAWVNWDGSSGSGNTIRASYNVSSVTRNSTGNYTINFTNALTDGNYAVAGSGVDGAGPVITVGSTSTTSCSIQTVIPNVSLSNCSRASVAIFR